MRIYSSPDVVVDEQKPGSLVVNSKHWERSRICEALSARSSSTRPHGGLADSITAAQIFSQAETENCFAVMAARWEPRRSIHHSIERNVSD
jgi:hypothetical protein